MKPQQKHWCENCDAFVPFNREQDFVTKNETFIIKGQTITIHDAKIPTCPTCQSEISDEVLDSELLSRTQDAYQQLTKEEIQ